MSYHIITLLAAAIAGLAGASLGGPVVAFAAAASIFATLEYIGSQRPIQRAWWQTDIIHRADVIILMAVNPIIDWVVIRITGKLPAYTGETIRLDRS